MSIKTISTREVYRNKWASLREDVIERSNGERGIYAVLDKPPACILIPLERDADGNEYLWLVGQYRYPAGAFFWEFPQGGWEDENVDVDELARGELAEETGLVAGRLTQLTMLWIAYGAMRQEHHVFLAEDLAPSPKTERDVEENDLEKKRVTVAEFEVMLLDGTIADNCTAAAWGVYCTWRKQQSEKLRS